MNLRERLESQISTVENLADEIVAELGNDMPDGVAHKRWLMTLGVPKLKERLRMLREQSEAGDGAAREIRLSSRHARGVHRQVCLSDV
jgi:hypothetical protein